MLIESKVDLNSSETKRARHRQIKSHALFWQSTHAPSRPVAKTQADVYRKLKHTALSRLNLYHTNRGRTSVKFHLVLYVFVTFDKEELREAK